MIPALLFLAAATAPTVPLARVAGGDRPKFEACVALAKADSARATTEAEAWVKEADSLPARHCLGLAYAAAEKWLSAATAFTRAATQAEAERNPQAATYWSQAGNAAIAADEPGLARTALDRALGSQGLTATMQGEAWLDRARADVALDDLPAARNDLDQGLKMVPDDPFAWLLSATLARRQKDLTRATSDIAEAVKRAPDDADVALEAGNVAMANGAADAAKVAWEHAKTLAPNEPAGQSAAAQLAQLKTK